MGHWLRAVTGSKVGDPRKRARGVAIRVLGPWERTY